MRYNFLIPKARSFIHLPTGRVKHFSFLLRKRKIVGFGYNQSYTTHPIAKQYGYLFDAIHSELDCILSFAYPPKELRKCTLVNLRFMADGRLGMSRPCPKCQTLLKNFGISEVYYSNRQGMFEAL